MRFGRKMRGLVSGILAIAMVASLVPTQALAEALELADDEALEIVDDVSTEEVLAAGETLDVRLSSAEATYNGSDQTPTIVSVSCGEERDIAPRSDENPDGYTVGPWHKDGNEVDEVKHAGTYTATVSYGDASAEVSFVVEPAWFYDFFGQVEIPDRVFDGFEQQPRLKFYDISGSEVDGFWRHYEYELSMEEEHPVEAGTYDVTVALKDGSDYFFKDDEGTFSYTIVGHSLDDTKYVKVKLDHSSVLLESPQLPQIERLALESLDDGGDTRAYDLTDDDYELSYEDASGNVITSAEQLTGLGIYYVVIDATSDNFTGQRKVPFNVVDAVARIDRGSKQTYVASIEDAVAEAKSGDTIVVVDDTEAKDVTIPADLSLTIDLNGKTLSSDDDGFYVDGELAITDSTEDQSGTLSVRWDGVSVNPSGTFELQAGTISAQRDAISIGGGTATVVGGTVASESAAAIKLSKSGSVTIGTADCAGYARTQHEHPTIAGATYGIEMETGALTIYCGLISGEEGPARKTDDASANLAGGYYSADTSELAALLADGQRLFPVANPAGYFRIGVAGVEAVEVVESGVRYASIAEAVSAVHDGETIRLLTDVEEGNIIVDDKNVTLDLGGKTLSSDTPDLIKVLGNGADPDDPDDSATDPDPYVGGTLTIVGEGTIAGPTDGERFDGRAVIVVEGGRLYFEGGTLAATGKDDAGMHGVYVTKGGSASFGAEADGSGPTITAHFAPIATNNTSAPASVAVVSGTFVSEADPIDGETGDIASWSHLCTAVYAAAAGSYDLMGGDFEGYYGFASPFGNVTQNVQLVARDDVHEDGAAFTARSGTQIFVDDKLGVVSAEPFSRHIFSTKSELTIPEWHQWVSDGDSGYLLEQPVVLNVDK